MDLNGSTARHDRAKRLFFAGAFTFAAAIGLQSAAALRDSFPRFQWDLAVYLAAGRAVDPYSVASRGLPFVYPPWTLPAFRSLAQLEDATAYRLWLAIKVAMLVATAAVWVQGWLRREERAAFLFAATLAFGAISADVATGNAATLEALALALAGVAFLRGQPMQFAACVVVAASLKLLPLALLPAALLIDGPRRNEAFAYGVLVAAVAIGTGYAFAPALWCGFADASAAVARAPGEHAFVNPSSLALARDLAGPRLGLLLYGAGALAVVITGARAARRHAPDLALAAVLLTYALASPRLKDYAFVALLAPAFLAIARAPGARALRVAAALLALLPVDALARAAGVPIDGIADGTPAPFAWTLAAYAPLASIAAAWTALVVTSGASESPRAPRP